MSDYNPFSQPVLWSSYYGAPRMNNFIPQKIIEQIEDAFCKMLFARAIEQKIVLDIETLRAMADGPV